MGGVSARIGLPARAREGLDVSVSAEIVPGSVTNSKKERICSERCIELASLRGSIPGGRKK